MSVRCFVEQLGSVGPHRMRRLVDDGTVTAFYVMVGPDRQAGVKNRQVWHDYLGLPLWAWYVPGESDDQGGDVDDITRLDDELDPAGWLLNIEKPLENEPLQELIKGVALLGKPMVASLAGANPNHHLYDHRTLDLHNVGCEWQAYIDSGEGPSPETAVRELYQTTQVLDGSDYRAQIKGVYGWGKIQAQQYVSFKTRGRYDLALTVRTQTHWPPLVVGKDRTLYKRDAANEDRFPTGEPVGVFMGLCPYNRIRVALDVTRGHDQARSLPEWTALAASAKAEGASRRGVTVYMLDNCPDDVLKAIAAGAP